MKFNNFSEIVNSAQSESPKTIAVAVAQDSDVLKAIKNAQQKGIVHAILVGDKEEIVKIASEHQLDIGDFKIVDVKDKEKACRTAVELASKGEAQLIMKGLVDSSVLLKAVLDKDIGLSKGTIMSHTSVFEIPGYDHLFFLSDAAMNMAPNLEQKTQILKNAVFVAHALGNEYPKVGVICAIEKINPKMQATVDAGELVKMNHNGLITGCIVGGPYALDNAISEESARHKGIMDPLAGHSEILLVPTIEAGNVLYKSIVYFAKAKSAGVIVGAKVPIILTSRADSDESKLNSIAIGVLLAEYLTAAKEVS